MNLAESIEELERKLAEFRQLMQEKSALQLSRQSLAKTIEAFIEKTEELKGILMELEKNSRLENSTITADSQIQEITALLVFLKRNLQFEQDKIQRSNPFNEISGKNEVPEVYNAIEEKTKKSLLSISYFIEKSTLSLHSEKASFSGSKPAQQVLQLLKAKDLELEELKKKYSSVMAQGLLARIEEQSSADFEEILNATATSLEVANSELQKLALENRGTIEKIQKNHSVLEQKIRQVDELLSKFQSKSLETITVLKKEKDSAKKFALDLEHETSALRQTYSKELLNLQEHKMQLQKELQQGFVQKTKGLETELKQKSEFLEHFKKLTEDKETELRQLKEKFEHQKAVLHHYAKHETIKKRHGKKTR
jgi:hypothetical protein